MIDHYVPTVVASSYNNQLVEFAAGTKQIFITVNSSTFSTYDNETGSYYLDYNNFVNTPVIPTVLTDLGIVDGTVGQVLTTNGTGVFSFQTGSAIDIIRTPVITVPAEGSTLTNFNPEIVGTAYAPAYSVDARDYRQFQVDVAAGDFSTPVADEQANSNSRTLVTTLGINTAYKVRIRDVATTGLASEYSNAVAFSTPDALVNAPTLTVEGAPSSVDKSPTLTTSAFSTDPVGGDTHAATDWEVRKTSDNSLVYASLNNATNLLLIQVPAGNLEVSTQYTFRARHIGTLAGPGNFAEVTATTVAVFDPVPLLAVAHVTTPFIAIYKRAGDTFTKLANPVGGLPASTGRGVAFSNTGFPQ